MGTFKKWGLLKNWDFKKINNFSKLLHSDESTEKASTFQGHSLHILSVNQATTSKNSIYQNPALSVASHTHIKLVKLEMR